MAEVYTPCSTGLSGSRLPLDPSRCKAGVWSKEQWSRYSQCSRKAINDGWCKVHHPDAVSERLQASNARYAKEARQSAMGWYGERFLAALVKIRDGDNDPRETARLALEGCDYEPRLTTPAQMETS